MWPGIICCTAMCLLHIPVRASEGCVPVPADIALQYVRACQNETWDVVVKMTAWMRERLDRACAVDPSPDKRATLAREMADALRRRTAEGNRLRAEGIEDVYLFAPGTKARVVRSDAGRSDLERPTRQRVWIQITYPSRAKAPRDEQGRAIRSLTAGVNISPDGLILKAGVLGNTEVDGHSISYRWED